MNLGRVVIGRRSSRPDSVPPARTAPVHPVVARAAAYSWRLLAIGLAVAAALWLVGQLLLVVLPLVLALLLARVLHPIAERLRRAGWRPALAASAALVGFLIALAAAVGVAGYTVARGLDDLGPTLSEGVDDLTDWLVDDGPFDISQADVDRWRQQAGDRLSEFLGEGGAASTAMIAGELVVGVLLALIVTFFFLRDGRRFVDVAVGTVAERRRPGVRRMGGRAWDALGGYLRGAALLGIIEATAIGLALLLVGAELVAPVMLVTFLAAFVPIVGAVAAGVVASLVALVTAGTVPAIIVAGVALVVQQLDNDLLAPVVYGRALRLHPLTILLGIAAGGALFGFVGTVLAVPVLAVGLNVLDEARHPSVPTATAADRPASRPAPT